MKWTAMANAFPARCGWITSEVMPANRDWSFSVRIVRECGAGTSGEGSLRVSYRGADDGQRDAGGFCEPAGIIVGTRMPRARHGSLRCGQLFGARLRRLDRFADVGRRTQLVVLPQRFYSSRVDARRALVEFRE